MSKFFYAVFCDDIRHEINGKLSYMGIYQGALYFPEFPASMPKLCISIHIMLPKDEEFKTICLSGSIDDEEVFNHELPKEQVQADKNSLVDTKDAKRLMIQTSVIATPITFEKPCRLQISIKVDEEQLEPQTLWVKNPPKGYVFQ